jgi:FMN reductase
MEPPGRLEVVAVYGAATPPGRLSVALDTAVEHLAAIAPTAVTRLGLNEAALGIAGTRALEEHDALTRDAVHAVMRADAVIIASPVYRASLPGVLKNLLDLLPVEALRGKPVGLLVVGATSHHFLGVERHMRDILSWFGALPLPVAVYLTNADFAEGAPSDAATSELQELAASLVRLAGALRGIDLGPPPFAARHG